MALKEYYNSKTKTLILPYKFEEELKDLPIDVKIIIFEEDLDKEQSSYFDKPVGHQECKCSNCPRNLPNSLTHLTFGDYFNQSVDNLPLSASA